jgi:hypothetical protein
LSIVELNSFYSYNPLPFFSGLLKSAPRVQVRKSIFNKHDFRFGPGKSIKEVGKRPQKVFQAKVLIKRALIFTGSLYFLNKFQIGS